MEDNLGVSVLFDPGVETKFDLVAVHGIKGHPYSTWTHPNGEKWLESYLPRDFPNTRILTFGYNAQIFTSSKGYVTDFAEQLLQHLISLRRSREEKALLLAHEGHDAAPLRRATRAVVFMGTPHRGSQLASYADTIVKCIKVAGLKANIANLQHLKQDSDNLDEMGSHFGSLLQTERIKVLTFYELKPMKIAGIAEAVLMSSGVDCAEIVGKVGLGPPLETVIPVDADHRQIAQFPSKDSKQYGVVRSNLALILSPQSQDRQYHDKQSQSDNDWADLLLWLEALRSHSGSTHLMERITGTCEWINNKESFQKWRFANGSAGLWIFGKPGVGKTVLSNYISEALRSELDCVVLTLYCHPYRSLNNPIHALLRDLLCQTLENPIMTACLRKQLSGLRAQKIAMPDMGFDTLLEVVHGILRSSSTTAFFIIDGIDELDLYSAELGSFLRTVSDLSRSAAKCKVLIVSRKITKAEKLLNGWETMEIPTSDTMNDITTFLNRKLADMKHLSQHQDEVIQRLLAGSKGLFLWADLAISELDHLRTWNEVEALLENGNRGLDTTYGTIIKQLDNSSEGLCRIRARALPLASVGCRPFRLEEMVELLAIEVSKGSVDPGNRLLGGWATLSRACGPFLQLNDLGAIELIHVSAKEFLMSYPWGQSLIGGSAEIEMACLCLSYLTLSFAIAGGTQAEDFELDVDLLSKQYPFLEYASQFCFDHFLRSESITHLQLSLLDKFLASPCSGTWTSSFYPHFALKVGESRGTIYSAELSIFANLQKRLRVLGSTVDQSVCIRCIKRLDRLLIDSRQDSLRMEMFHSGPAAPTTIEKKLRLAECYSAMAEHKAAEETSSEAFETAKQILGQIHPLTLQLERVKLYSQVRIQENLGSVERFDSIREFIRLVESHIEVSGPHLRETNVWRNDLAFMYIRQQDFNNAQKILEPLHRRMVETLGHNSRFTQRVANNLAACANMQGQYDYAESILNTIPGLAKAAAEPLEIDITSVPIETLNSLSTFAAVLGAKDEDRRSEILHQRVIDALMVLKGPKTRQIYESAINKGQALRDQFKYKEARKHYIEWLKKSDLNFGPNSEYSCMIRERQEDLDQQERKWKEMSQELRVPVIQGFRGWKGPRGTAPLGIVIFLIVVSFVWLYF